MQISKMLKNAFEKVGDNAVTHAVSIKDKLGDAAEKLAKEAELGPVIHDQAIAAIARMQEFDTSLKSELEKAYGYAVFPSLARASAVLAVSYGRGEVFQKGNVIGYAGVVQITLGGQLGGETLHELVIFYDKSALEAFKAGKTSFAANASAALVKAGAVAGRSPSGFRTFLFSEGGMMLEAAIGTQTFRFVPAALGRLREGPEQAKKTTSQGKAPPRADERPPADSPQG